MTMAVPTKSPKASRRMVIGEQRAGMLGVAGNGYLDGGGVEGRALILCPE